MMRAGRPAWKGRALPKTRLGLRVVAVVVAVVLALGLVGGGSARAADIGSGAAAGPHVILCLYGPDGVMRAGHPDCPPEARQQDAMLPEAHCFYGADGRLWRGLPRCPRDAPAFLLDEARGTR